MMVRRLQVRYIYYSPLIGWYTRPLIMVLRLQVRWYSTVPVPVVQYVPNNSTLCLLVHRLQSSSTVVLVYY